MPESSKKKIRSRTFTGCWTCRSRKVKCDEASPSCTQCRNLGKICSGYQSKLVWVTSEHKKYKAHGRRFLHTETTWDGYPILESDHVDALIDQLDINEVDSAPHVILEDSSFSPFRVLRIEAASMSSIQYEGSMVCFQRGSSSERELSPDDSSLDVLSLGPALKMSPAMSMVMPEDNTAAFLFHHYVNHISPLMMPFEDSENPWKCIYPAIAIEYGSKEQRCLYKGMQAQAAFHLAQLRCDSDKMQALGTARYASAMEQLREAIAEEARDYGTFLAAAITLTMVEVYNGKSKLWRIHLKAAWNFFDQQRKNKPWRNSDIAYMSTQAICMIQTTSSSSTSMLDEPDDIMSQLLRPDEDGSSDIIMLPPKPPLTATTSMGVTKSLMSCIADIKRVEYILHMGKDAGIMEDAISDLYRRLTDIEVEAESSSHSYLRYHSNAFRAATLIYLQRSLFNLPPSSLQTYVSQVFCNLTAFQREGGRVLAVWPAFIAAVEVYQEQDMLLARRWLDTATGVGMGNRMKIKSVVEAVWEIRETTMIETGVPKGSIVVDWRDVMRDLDIDILLV